MLKRVDNMGIAVSDVKQAIEFYNGKLGLALARPFQEGQTSFSVSLGDISFWVFQTQNKDALKRNYDFPNNPVGVDHIAIEVDDIEVADRELATRGIVFMGPIVGPPGAFRYRGFPDPDGNMLYIIQRPR